MIEKLFWKIMIFSTWLNILVSGLSQSNKSFSKCNPRKLLSYKNRAGFMKILICAGKKNGVPQWQFTDGSSTLGEVFNPARDCSDIVAYVPDAEDGFYWIALDKKTKQKVWCDVHTDGGGFMLVGMKDSPVSWTVPSNSTPVDPQGPPHWSSVLGNVRIIDFGVQFSSNKTFQGSEAHWFYRLKQKRKLGELFTNDKSSGCTASDPGIGDVMFVKDVRTGSVATTNFNCSIFGPHTHPSLGWARMNDCLRRACKNGYGVFPGPVPFHYAQYGSFSYSAVSALSGTDHDSTAFVGCDNGKCCACFGPKGGKQNYCGPKCTAVNGGTVSKKVFVWFWVRTRLPERVWKRCMEFTKTNSIGRIEKYFIDRQTGTAHKGSCSEQFKTFLNEGTLTVSDKESLKKIPDVPGLLSYRKDNKQLYVNQGAKWEALSNEQEVKQLHQEVKSLENMMKKEYQGVLSLINKYHRLNTSCSILRTKLPSAPSGMYSIKPKGLDVLVPVYCDMTSKNGVGVTLIGHDSESRTLVHGYESPGSYQRKIKYHLPMEHVVAIIEQSQNCQQFIKYECLHSVLLSGPYGWWVSRQGWKMNYWGGAAVNSGKCACGMTNNCAGGGKCNCEQNDLIWREDSGYLTDKYILPVTQLRFGDTGSNEYGYHTLGKLRCWD